MDHIGYSSRIASFYRAMRMHSANYAVARYLSVSPSVRHTPVLCLNDYTYPQSFSSSGSPPFKFFHTKWDGNIPTGTPLTGTSNARGYEKNHDFRPIYRFVSKLMQATVTMEGEEETTTRLLNGTSFNDLE